MGFRINIDTVRTAPFEFRFDGTPVEGHTGETVAAALLADGRTGSRRDSQQRWRGPYCNMGTCFECLIELQLRGNWVRVRACLTPVSAALEVRSASSPIAAQSRHE
jgi:hypothetical protein